MNSQERRLNAIELTLTPYQTVLLWMKNTLKGTFEECARGSPQPRAAIANSLARTVRNGLKGQPETVVEQAILQARREADLLYMLVIEVNAVVQQSFLQREREYLFFLGFVEASMSAPVTSDSLQQFRNLTLIFVNEILELDCSISQLSTERFGGQPILFSDSALKLQEQLDLAGSALECFNFWAKELKVTELTAEGICEQLRLLVDRQVSRWLILASGAMLAVFGDAADLQASFDQLFQLCECERPQTEVVRRDCASGNG